MHSHAQASAKLGSMALAVLPRKTIYLYLVLVDADFTCVDHTTLVVRPMLNVFQQNFKFYCVLWSLVLSDYNFCVTFIRVEKKKE